MWYPWISAHIYIPLLIVTFCNYYLFLDVSLTYLGIKVSIFPNNSDTKSYTNLHLMRKFQKYIKYQFIKTQRRHAVKFSRITLQETVSVNFVVNKWFGRLLDMYANFVDVNSLNCVLKYRMIKCRKIITRSIYYSAVCLLICCHMIASQFRDWGRRPFWWLDLFVTSLP